MSDKDKENLLPFQDTGVPLYQRILWARNWILEISAEELLPMRKNMKETVCCMSKLKRGDLSYKEV